MQVPSGENLTVLTPSKWSIKVWIRVFLVTSHNLTVWSSPHEAIKRESGENLTHFTQFECPK
jgi:hypothetical protein